MILRDDNFILFLLKPYKKLYLIKYFMDIKLVKHIVSSL